MIRLNKYIALCGVCSRRKADELIEKGAISVNDIEIVDFGTMIDEEKDVVKAYGRKIEAEEKKVYIMLNKPKGYITTNDEQFSRSSTAELIHEDVRVYPIGRLDMDTEGLLILTNDGEFANMLTHPKHSIEKTYIVSTKSSIDPEKLKRLERGVDIGDYITREAKVKMISDHKLQIVIREGKNRQIRKMCSAVGIDVLDLKRVKIGNVMLGNLKPGKYEYIDIEKIEKMKKSCENI